MKIDFINITVKSITAKKNTRNKSVENIFQPSVVIMKAINFIYSFACATTQHCDLVFVTAGNKLN